MLVGNAIRPQCKRGIKTWDKTIRNIFNVAGSPNINKTLGYVSDIHLESNHHMNLNINPTTDYLMLCGDIGDPFDPRYRNLIDSASNNFERVIFVAGNHEFGNIRLHQNKENLQYVFDETIERLREIASEFSNVEFLHRDVTDLDGYKVIGTTLWTERVNKAVAKHRNVKYTYNQSYNDIINLEHDKDKKFIEDELSKSKSDSSLNQILNKGNIVLTHHIPSIKMCPPQFMHYNSKNLFYNDLDYLLMNGNIYAWLCGHSHHIEAKMIYDIYCGINSVGIGYSKINELVKIYL